MACRTPVVVWENRFVPQVVADGETGFIVQAMQEMAAAIGPVGEPGPACHVG
jgi:glycosyltransferase involved in cell wall biosynthesis